MDIARTAATITGMQVAQQKLEAAMAMMRQRAAAEAAVTGLMEMAVEVAKPDAASGRGQTVDIRV